MLLLYGYFAKEVPNLVIWGVVRLTMFKILASHRKGNQPPHSSPPGYSSDGAKLRAHRQNEADEDEHSPCRSGGPGPQGGTRPSFGTCPGPGMGWPFREASGVYGEVPHGFLSG